MVFFKAGWEIDRSLLATGGQRLFAAGSSLISIINILAKGMAVWRAAEVKSKEYI